MSLLEIICKKLGVKIGKEWTGSDGKSYIIEEEAILNLEPCKDSVTGYSWELCSGGTYQKILSGEIKPAWQPKRGDLCYAPFIYKDEDERYHAFFYEDYDPDTIQWYLENNLLFKTKEEAISVANKIISKNKKGE